MKNFDPSPNIKNMIPALDLSPFTSREVDIIACLIHRRSSKAIGSLLSLSDKTVSNHICNMMSKVGCTSREGILDYVEGVGYMPLLHQHYAHLNPTAFTEEQQIIKASPNSTSPLAKKGRIFWGVSVSIFLLLIGGGMFLSLQLSPKKPKEFIARSDLILPSKSIALNRPEFITKIDEKLKEKEGIQTVALIGIGGSGKTTLARQYAQRQQASIVWEINAESYRSLQTSFENLALSLIKTEVNKKLLRKLQGIKDNQERESKILSFVKERLRSVPEWFLIYDNVEKFSDLQKYFPHDPKNWGNGKVLITTQNANIQNDNHITHVVQIDKLSSEQKFELFSKIMTNIDPERFTNEKKEEFQKFLEEIPPFPLDVSVAAYYLQTTGIPYERYIPYINQDDEDYANINEKIQAETSTYHKTRFSIITASLKNILNINNEFSDLLLLISLLDSQKIPRELLIRYKNDILVDDFIYHLKKYSLISNEASLYSTLTTFSMHRITQTICLNYLRKSINPEKMPHIMADIAKNIESYTFEKITAENNFNIKVLANHLEKLLTHKEFSSPIIWGSISGELGRIYFRLGNYVKAKKLFEESLALLNKHVSLYPIKIAKNLEWLGNSNRELGNYKNAVALLEESLSLYRKGLPENNENVARVLAHLGNAYRNLGEVKKAKSLLEQSLKMYRNYYSENHATLAQVLGYLGHIYWILGDLKNAKNMHEESHKLYITYCPANKIGIARSFVYLGKTYDKLGELKAAQTSLEKSIELYKKYYGETHIDLAWASVHLGSVYTEQGNYEKAEKVLQKVLECYQKHYDDGHIDIAWVSMHLGSTYSHLGRHDEAINLLEKSKINYEKTFGKNHTDTAMVLTKLGNAHFLKGSLNEAELYTGQALQIFNEHKHPESYTSLENLGEIYRIKMERAQKNPNRENFKGLRDQASSFFEAALKIVKDNFPKDSPHLIRIQNKLKSLSS